MEEMVGRFRQAGTRLDVYCKVLPNKQDSPYATRLNKAIDYLDAGFVFWVTKRPNTACK